MSGSKSSKSTVSLEKSLFMGLWSLRIYSWRHQPGADWQPRYVEGVFATHLGF